MSLLFLHLQSNFNCNILISFVFRAPKSYKDEVLFLVWSRHHPWRYLKDVQMWHLRTGFSGGFRNVGSMVGLDDCQGPFQA